MPDFAAMAPKPFHEAKKFWINLWHQNDHGTAAAEWLDHLFKHYHS